MDPITGIMIGYRVAQLGWDTVRRLKTWNEYTPLKPVALGDFGLPIPRLDGSTVIPIVWGRDRVRNPLIAWAGNPNTNGVLAPSGDPIVIAQKYRLDVSLCFGMPGGQGSRTLLPTTSPGIMRKLWFGEKAVAAGGSSATQTHQIDEPYLFGGPGAGGGVDGVMIWYPGTFTQNPRSEIAARWDENGDDSTLTPAYRGFMMLHLLSFNVGEDPHLEPISAEVECATLNNFAGASPFPTVLGKIGDGDANPANVIYDLYTNWWGRMGRPAAELDLDALYAAGLVFADEQLGWTMVVDQQRDAGDILEEILRQVDGFMYVEPTTNLMTIALNRDDFDAEDLPLLDDSNVLKVVGYQTATWEGTYNEFQGTFLNRAKDYETDQASEHDAANFAIQGNVSRTMTVDWPGCRTLTLAKKLTARTRRQFSQPMVKTRLLVNRDGYTLRPGMKFRWTRERWNISEKVMIVLDTDLGDGRSSTIVVDAIEWVPDVAVGSFDFPPIHLPSPKPVLERIAEEAPRWLALRASSTPAVADPDQPHTLYLAVPRGTTASHQGILSYTGDLELDEADSGPTFGPDTAALVFPGRFRVAASYSRTAEPYDTTVGLVIKDVVGWTPHGDSALLIASRGRNLLRVGDEWIAFGTATDNGDGTWTLGNVWRGLLDTVPVDHDVDERGYAPFGAFGFTVSRIGSTETPYPASVDVRWRVIGGLTAKTPTDPLFVDDYDVALRALSPYPVADLKLGGTKVPLPLDEEGVDLTWKRRNRTAATITRGDAAAETPDVGTSYDVLGRKGDVEAVLAEGYTGDSASDVHLGPAGYGEIDVLVRSTRTETLADGSTIDLTSWQDPAIPIVAEEWRNLLLNPRFADGTTHWTITSGALQVVTDTTGLGGGGSYVMRSGAGANIQFQQRVDISGFLPYRLRALIEVHGKNFNLDTDDALTVFVGALDEDEATISTASYGPTAQSTTQWLKRTVDIANLPADTAKIGVIVALTGVTGSGDDATLLSPDSAVAELSLQVGQFTDQLLTNPDFESGLTGWTSVSGTFTVSTATPLYTGAQYVKGDAAADSEYRQDYAVSSIPGYEIGATVVCKFALKNSNAAAGTARVTVECRDGSGSLAAVSTGDVNVGTTWVRQRLTVDVPAGTTTIRVRLISTRTAGVASACFDGFDLRVHKQLDPALDLSYDWSEPAVQHLPTTVDLWEARYEDVLDAPDLCFWTGDSLEGVLNREPDLETDDALTGQKFVGAWDGDSIVTDAWEFPIGTTGAITTQGNVTFGNFSSDDPFAFLLAVRFARPAGGRYPIIQRYDGVAGWSVGLEDDGVPWALVAGTSTLEMSSSSAAIDDGAIHLIGVVYDPDAQEIHLVTPDGTDTVSTAAAGDFANDDNVRFEVGNAPGMQIARIYGWRSAVDPADLAAIMTHATDPTAALTSAPGRGVAAACVVGQDDDGVLIGRFAADQVAIGYDADLTAGGGTGFGLVKNAAATNLAPSSDVIDTANWSRPSSPATATEVSGPEGFQNAIRLAGTSSSSQRLQLQNVTVAGGDPDVFVVWLARLPAGEASHTATVKLEDTSGVVKATHTYTPTADWQVFSHKFTSWDGASATCRLSFHASADGTSRQVELAGPVFIDQVGIMPALIPITSGASATVNAAALDLAPALTAQFNIEGEVAVTGWAHNAAPASRVIVTLSNGVDGADLKGLSTSATAQAQLEHYDSAAAGVTSETAAQTWDQVWTVRGRWCRAGLIEAANAFAGVVFGDDLGAPADYDRTVTWAAGAAPTDVVALGAPPLGTSMNALIRSLRLTARETRLPPA